MTALGLLDDLSFARGFAGARLGGVRGFGPRRVAVELARRGVARAVVDRVLAELREEGAACEEETVDGLVSRRAMQMRGLARKGSVSILRIDTEV